MGIFKSSIVLHLVGRFKARDDRLIITITLGKKGEQIVLALVKEPTADQLARIETILAEK